MHMLRATHTALVVSNTSKSTLQLCGCEGGLGFSGPLTGALGIILKRRLTWLGHVAIKWTESLDSSFSLHGYPRRILHMVHGCGEETRADTT